LLLPAVGAGGGFIVPYLHKLTRRLFSQRIRPLVILAVSVLLIFTASRAVLLILNRTFLEQVSRTSILRCFGMGLRYDMVPLGYMMLPVIVATSLVGSETFARKGFRRFVTAYAAGLLTLVASVEVIGAVFFLNFYRRLNWAALNYPRHPKEVLTNIWISYPLWLFIPLVVLVCYVLYRLLARWFWRGRVVAEPRWVSLVRLGLLIGLAVLACRGGLEDRPLCSGSAYYSSNNNIISQLTLNNFFTFFRAARSTVTDGRSEDKDFSFPPESVARRVTTQMLITPGDNPAGDPGNPLWRKSPAAAATLRGSNVVVIIMESMSSPAVGILGHSPSYTPNLDAICREGMYFEDMYAVGSRTSRALTSVLCGFPDLRGISILERRKAQGKFFSLAEVFRRRGYRTLFVYGGDSDFDNMRGFFSAAGIETFIDQKQVATNGAPVGCWGAADEAMFAKANETFRSMGDEKFFAVVLTVSNHRPYDIPPGRVPELAGNSERIRSLNACRYADWALGRFFEAARKEAYFKNTVFVLVADHCKEPNPSFGIDVPGFRIPCVFYAPGRIKPTRIATTCSQTDIAPTLLSLMGEPYEHCFMGRDVLSLQPDQGFALMHHDDYLGFVRNGRALVLPPEPRQQVDPDREPISVLFDVTHTSMTPIPPDRTDPQVVADYKLRMLSSYDMARLLYARESYHEPARMAGRSAIHTLGTFNGM